MQQSPWDATSRSAGREISLLLWKSKFHYHVHKSPPIPRPCETFRNKLDFCSEEFLAPRPTSKVDTPYRLSAIGDLNINSNH
jgi:hypothetical protein